MPLFRTELQPIYTFTFSNGLIACFVMGIGTLLDVGYVMARPFQSIFIARCSPSLAPLSCFPLRLRSV